MSFNPDLSKQAQELKFSREMKNLFHPQIFTGKAHPQVKFKGLLSVNMDIWIVGQDWWCRN